MSKFVLVRNVRMCRNTIVGRVEELEESDHTDGSENKEESHPLDGGHGDDGHP